MISKKLSMKNFLIILTACLLLTNCQQKTEGCLDPEAINFAVEVDKSCDSCCQYPLLQINLGAIWGDEANTFSYQKIWTDAQGKPFKIDTIAFYLSDFQLINSATGKVAAIMDSVRLRIFPDSLGEFFQRDIILARPTNGTYNVGTMLVKGSFDQIKFKIGLGNEPNNVIPTRTPASHPLRPQPEGMWGEATKSFYFLKIKMKKDTAAATAQTIYQWPKSLGTREVVLDFSKSTSWKRGISPVVRLVVDYSKWFDGVDLNQSDAVIFDKILNNVEASFVLKAP